MSTTTPLQPFVEQFLDERRQLGFDTRTLVRQAKLGASCRVKVPVGEGS